MADEELSAEQFDEAFFGNAKRRTPEEEEAIRQENIASQVHPQPQTPEEVAELMSASPTSEPFVPLDEKTKEMLKVISREPPTLGTTLDLAREAENKRLENEVLRNTAEAQKRSLPKKPSVVSQLSKVAGNVELGTIPAVSQPKETMEKLPKAVLSKEIETPRQKPFTSLGATETAHSEIPLLRLQLAQIVNASPYSGDALALSDDERVEAMPVAVALIKVLRDMKNISPDINVRDELSAIESSSGYNDGEKWLESIEDGHFGDQAKAALYGLAIHVPRSADEAIHADEIVNHPVVKYENQAGNILVTERTDNYGDNYAVFKSADEAIKHFPNLDESKLDEFYQVDTGTFRIPKNADLRSNEINIEAPSAENFASAEGTSETFDFNEPFDLLTGKKPEPKSSQKSANVTQTEAKLDRQIQKAQERNRIETKAQILERMKNPAVSQLPEQSGAIDNASSISYRIEKGGNRIGVYAGRKVSEIPVRRRRRKAQMMV